MFDVVVVCVSWGLVDGWAGDLAKRTTSRLEAIVSRLEAITRSLEAMAIRLEAIASIGLPKKV